MNSRELWTQTLESHRRTLEKTRKDGTLEESVILAAEKISEAVNSERTVMFFGNGGSAADAQHIAAEFVGKFNEVRKPLNVISLSTNASIITAIANDIDFNGVFSRQVSAMAKEGDIVVGITTSGSSKSVLNAFDAAKEKGAITIVMTGEKAPNNIADIIIRVPESHTPCIQEMHIMIGHYLADYAERNLLS